MHVEPYLRHIFEKCKCLLHGPLTALSGKKRNLAKLNDLMARHVEDGCQITQTDAQAVGGSAANPTNEFPARTPQLVIYPRSFLGGNWLFQEPGE